MIVRCTARLLNLLGKPNLSLVEAPPHDDDWYANLLWLDRRKCLLLTHAGTLFPILATDIRKRDLLPLGPYLVDLIESALRTENLPAHALGPLEPDSVSLARTASRHVLGVMTEIAFQCRWQLESVGGLEDIDTGTLNHHLRRTLHHHNGDYHKPLELLEARLQSR